MKTTTILIFILIAGLGFAQKTCMGPEYNQFDFWLGDWEGTWTDSTGQAVRGINSVTKDLDDCIVHEHVTSNTFRAESISAYDKTKKVWQQTWVDNKGTYIFFTGGIKDGVMDLRAEHSNLKGQSELFSITWSNVKANSLDWVRRRSVDGGKKWQILEKIHYTKRTDGHQSAPSAGSPISPAQPPTQTSGAPPPTTPSRRDGQ